MNWVRNATTAALAAVALWATNATVADTALVRMSVFQLLVVQYGAAVLILIVGRGVALVRDRCGRRGRVRGVRIPALAVGVIGLTGTIFLQYLAFAAAPIVAANVIAYGWPLMAAMWIAVTHRTPQALRAVPMAVLGFGGVALIFGAQGLDADGSGLGYVAALGSAACMAFYTVAAGRMSVPATSLLVPATVAGTVAAGIVTTAQATPWPPPTTWLAAAYIGAGPMAAGYGLWTYAMSRGGADRLSPIGYATPLLSTMVLIATGRPFTTQMLVGAALILACCFGVLLNDRTARRGDQRSVTQRTDAGQSAARERQP